jgi:hypothetical protein
MQCEFFEDIMNMAFDGIYFDAEPMGDFLIAETFGNQCDDFTFTFRHPHCIGQFPFPFPECMLDYMREKRSRQQGRKNSYPPRYRPDCPEEILYRRVFEDKTRRTGLHKLDDVQSRRDKTHPDHFSLGQFPGQSCHNAQAVFVT